MAARFAKIILLAVIAMGLLFRLIYLAELVRDPRFIRPRIDAAYYDYWARALISGDWTPPPRDADPVIPGQPYFKPPGYPFFLAGLYRLSGGSYLFPRVFQMLLGLAGAVLAYLIGRGRVGKRAALIWAALLAGYWTLIFYEGELLELPPVIFLFLALFGLLLRWSDSPSLRRVLAPGLVLGVIALMRPNFLALPAAILPWQFWVLGRAGRRRFPASAGVFLLAVLLPIAPVALRNYAVSGEFVPIATYGGLILEMANQPDPEALTRHTSPVTGNLWSAFDYPRIVRRLARDAGRPLTPAQASSFLARRAWGWIWTHPREFLRRLGVKTVYFWGPREISKEKEDEYERRHSPLLSTLPGSFPLVLALAITGAGLWWISAATAGPFSPSRRVLALLLGVAAVYFLSFLPFIAGTHYRVPLLPFLLLLGAAGVDRFIYYLRRRDWKIVLPAAAGFGVLCFLTRIDPTGYRPRPDRGYFGRAAASLAAGREAEALELYRRGVAIDPNLAEAWKNMGVILSKQGRSAEALFHYQQALRIDPDSAETYNNLGIEYAILGREEEALRHFREALRLEPDYAQAWNNLGLYLRDLGRPEEAAEHFRIGRFGVGP